MQNKETGFLFLALCFIQGLQAQDSSRVFTLSGYAEAYYQYDFNKPASRERPWFLYNHKRHNEWNVNLAYLKAAWSDSKTYANLAFMAGTYAEYNLAQEPALLQQVLEANAGYRFSGHWSMEAGILPSHIGIESAVSKDCWNLSRSLLAENSPYYEAGVKLNYTDGDRWSAALLLLNGWQNIRENNRHKALGAQLQFRPGKGWLLNYSHFVGREKPDSIKGPARLFHNLYGSGPLTSQLNLAVLLDIGTEGQRSWYGSAVLLQYIPVPKFRAGFRAERYKDIDGLNVSSPVPGGFLVNGYSLNTDFIPSPHLSCRAELRYLRSSTRTFEKAGGYTRDNLSLLCSLAVSF